MRRFPDVRRRPVAEGHSSPGRGAVACDAWHISARHGERNSNPSAPDERDAQAGRDGDSAGALLRPRLRPGDHAVHAAHGGRAHVGGHREGPPGAGGPVVVLDRLRLAHQRGRSRGGRGAPRHLRRDGGPPGRVHLRARGLRRLGAHLRGRLRGGAGRPTSPCSGSRARTTRTCASPPAAWASRLRSRAASWSPRHLRTALCREPCGSFR